MNIIIVAPRNSSNFPLRFDYALWNFYLPLLKLGHSVSFFDSGSLGNQELRDRISEETPDLLFCIMTGDAATCPNEPWEVISEETKKGSINTFNWFCDDSYRFDSFSKRVCNTFRWCSTPELKYVDNYKSIGYNNIVYATWHANSDIYLLPATPKKIYDISFVGGLHGDRFEYIDYLQSQGNNISVPISKVSFEDMLSLYSASKVCLNFTKDYSKKNTQMKARIFEILATKSLLLTEYTEDLENCFPNNQLLTFKNKEELSSKLKWINDNKENCEKIRLNSYAHFIKNHTSEKRLKDLLDKINEP